MFEWLFGKKEGTTKTIAILDIGSGSVGGALGTLNHEGVPELLFTTREEMPLRMTRSASEMAKDAAAASKVVLDQVRKAAALWNENNRITPKKIDHLAVFLAAPWSSGTIHTLKITEDEPFAMSPEVVRHMLSEEIRTSSAAQHESVEVLERIATGLKLNGYPVDAITHTTVKEAEVTLATSLAPKSFLSLLLGALGEMPQGTRKSFHSFGLPVAHILPRITSGVGDMLLVDAGAEITEIIRVRDGVPTDRATAPVGTHMLLRTLRAHGKMQKKEAETTLKLAQLDGTRLSETHTSAIVAASKEWAKTVLAAAASISEEGAVPLYAYLFADPAPAHWLTDALAKEPYPKQSTPIHFVLPITPKDFEKTMRLRGAAPDIFLAAELVFADERFDEDQALELLSPRDPLLARQKPSSSGGIVEGIQ